MWPAINIRFVSVSLFILMQLLPVALPVRLWKTLFMDDDDRCNNFIRNQDMAEKDFYLVKADRSQGHHREGHKPAECGQNFNLGDRFVFVRLVQWWCESPYIGPFLAVYDTCGGHRDHLLAVYNCSNRAPFLVQSSGPCLLLYHYRGHQPDGYFFVVEVTAGQEIIAFPTGGIAAIVIGSIIVILIIMKIICMASGWEERLPSVQNDGEDTKFIFHPEEGCVDVDIQETQLTPASQQQIFCRREDQESRESLLRTNDPDDREPINRENNTSFRKNYEKTNYHQVDSDEDSRNCQQVDSEKHRRYYSNSPPNRRVHIESEIT